MTDFLWQSTPLMGALVFVLGSCVGSFINVVAYRLPIMTRADTDTSRFNWPTRHRTACLAPTLLCRGKTCRLLPMAEGKITMLQPANCFFLSAYRTAHWCCERRYLRPPDRRVGAADRIFDGPCGCLGLFWWLTIAIITTSRQHPVSVSPHVAKFTLARFAD